MRKTILVLCLMFASSFVFAQKKIIEEVKENTSSGKIETDYVYFVDTDDDLDTVINNFLSINDIGTNLQCLFDLRHNMFSVEYLNETYNSLFSVQYSLLQSNKNIEKLRKNEYKYLIEANYFDAYSCLINVYRYIEDTLYLSCTYICYNGWTNKYYWEYTKEAIKKNEVHN